MVLRYSGTVRTDAPTPGTTDADTPTRAGRPSPAQRLLDTAGALFAEHGIRAVGIDRILAEAGVARASLYSSYGSKDALVIAYLHDLDMRDRERWAEAVADVRDPVDRILAFFDLALRSAPRKNFRGCQYANAATEFPQETFEPVLAHREWLRRTIVEQLGLAGVDDADRVAAHVQLIYDGALAGSKFEHSVEPIGLGRAMAAELVDAHRQASVI